MQRLAFYFRVAPIEELASSRDTSGCRMVPLVPEPGLLSDLVLAAGYRFWLEAVEQLRILDMDTCRHTIDQLASVLGIQVLYCWL